MAVLLSLVFPILMAICTESRRFQSRGIDYSELLREVEYFWHPNLKMYWPEILNGDDQVLYTVSITYYHIHIDHFIMS